MTKHAWHLVERYQSGEGYQRIYKSLDVACDMQKSLPTNRENGAPEGYHHERDVPLKLKDSHNSIIPKGMFCAKKNISKRTLYPW